MYFPLYPGSWEVLTCRMPSLATTASSTKPASGTGPFFYHFIDIAIVNAFILHKQITKTMGQPSMTQKAFREILILELHGCGSTRTDRPSTPATPAPGCIPVYPSGDSTVGRRRCALCHQRTPVVCRACDVTLCLLPKRNCFEEWHDRNV